MLWSKRLRAAMVLRTTCHVYLSIGLGSSLCLFCEKQERYSLVGSLVRLSCTGEHWFPLLGAHTPTRTKLQTQCGQESSERRSRNEKSCFPGSNPKRVFPPKSEPQPTHAPRKKNRLHQGCFHCQPLPPAHVGQEFMARGMIQ